MNLKEKYNQKTFLSFLENQFLPDDFDIHIEKLDIEFKTQFIKKVALLGNVDSLSLKVYEIEHISEHDPRVSLSKETFKLMASYGAKQALVFFVSPKSENYRFSLINIDLKLEGRRVTKEYTNPRRYSFYLGPDAKTHTPEDFLIKKGRVKDFKDLFSRFNVEVVTKEFFKELSNWYFWAIQNVQFPRGAEIEKNGQNIAVIRLITRLIFIWFMKQKELVPNYLFNKSKIEEILVDLSNNKSTYYKAILQNLFFATLNTPIKKRRFREKKNHEGINRDYAKHEFYRYEEYFRDPSQILQLFKGIPFLNGGLFECLDKKREKIIIDGFSRVLENQPIVPNFLFFSDEQLVDLNKEYGTKNKIYRVEGLINILQRYNFTIDENTPVDIEVALDPELLGRVFENLLASYNPETTTTARKSTGSYYTPRPIVHYMVDESLKAYFRTKLSKIRNINEKIKELFFYDTDTHSFNKKETKELIKAIDEIKIIDPAVGSGAFPMGVLQRLVYILSKLDSNNRIWRDFQQKRILEKIERAYDIKDEKERKKELKELDDTFNCNTSDYGRKLYLIKNCIFGVDIQPIAIQITKLRFFISLLVDIEIDKNKKNYAVDPLPNLETKFVAANSLINLDIGHQVSLFKTSEVSELEKELKGVRSKYFNASIKTEKEKLRKRDKNIREKIAKSSLSKFLPEATQKIANWDPYNSNVLADWFDPEWMFGVSDGFDIVIANPPYLHIRTKSFDRKKLPMLQKNFKLAIGQFDFFVLFTELSSKLLKRNGVYAFIIPKRVLSNQNYKPIRKFYIEHLPIISYLDAKMPFEFTAVEANVLIAQKTMQKRRGVEISEFHQNHIVKKPSIELDLAKKMPFFIFPFTLSKTTVDLLIKISEGNNKLSQFVSIIRGYEFGFNHRAVSNKKCMNNYKLIRGENIGRYHIQFGGFYLDKKLLNQKDAKEIDMFLPPKLVTRFVSNDLIFAYDNVGYHNTNVVYNIHFLTDQIELKYLLALLNSTLLNFWFKKSFLNEDMLFPHIQKNQLEVIPIKIIDNTEKQKLINVVDKILTITKDDDYLQNEIKQKKVKEYEKQIDGLVYKLYDLNLEEIEVVENFNK